MRKQLDVFEYEGDRVGVALAKATIGYREDGEVEWTMDGVQVVFVWSAYFKWSRAGEAVALSIGEVCVRIGTHEEKGWRCVRPRSIHESVAKYAATVLRREAERENRKQERLESQEQLERWREGEDPFKDDDEP